MINEALYSSKSDMWETPHALYNTLYKMFDFQLDVCAIPENAKCEQYFTPEQNGLQQSWHPHKRIWMNPPYGRDIGKWMQKAYEESIKGCIVVCLVHARTDTRWWHNWVQDKANVTFVKGRLKFGNAKHSAPFPSAIVVYGINIHDAVNGGSH